MLCPLYVSSSTALRLNWTTATVVPQLSAMNRTLCASVLLFRGAFRLKAPHTSAGTLAAVTTAPAPHYSSNPSRCPYSTNIKVRSYLQYMKRKIKPPPSPPYSHVCQVGDPVLRSQAAAVDPAAITGPEVQLVINTMVKVMRKLECVGLSAPQIGVPLRILTLEYTEKMLRESSPVSREACGISAQPLRIFVNPQLRVLDRQTFHFLEACESISGFSAMVPRYLSVEVSGRYLQSKLSQP